MGQTATFRVGLVPTPPGRENARGPEPPWPTTARGTVDGATAERRESARLSRCTRPSGRGNPVRTGVRVESPFAPRGGEEATVTTEPRRWNCFTYGILNTLGVEGRVPSSRHRAHGCTPPSPDRHGRGHPPRRLASAVLVDVSEPGEMQAEELTQRAFCTERYTYLQAWAALEELTREVHFVAQGGRQQPEGSILPGNSFRELHVAPPRSPRWIAASAAVFGAVRGDLRNGYGPCRGRLGRAMP